MLLIIKTLNHHHANWHFKSLKNLLGKHLQFKNKLVSISNRQNYKPCQTWFQSFKGHKFSRKTSHFLFLSGSIILAKAYKSNNVVLCESQVPSLNQDRLDSYLITPSKDSNDPLLTWNQFWLLLKPQIHYFVAAVISALVVAFANINAPIILREIVNIISTYTHRQDNTGNFLEEIYEPSLRIMKMYFTQAGFTFLYITFLTQMGERMATDLREQLFLSYLKQDIAFYDEHKVGELVSRLANDVQEFKSSLKMCISQGLRSITQIIGCGVSLLFVSPCFATITFGVVSSIIAVGSGFGRILKSLSRKAQHQIALAMGVADECLGNIRTVRAFAMEDQEFALFDREIKKSEQLNKSLGFGIGLFQGATNLFLNGITYGTLYAAGCLLTSGRVEPGDLMTFLVYAQMIQRSLSQLSVVFGSFVRGMSSGARVFQYINHVPEIPLHGGKKISYHSLIGELEFKGVCFSYPTRPEQDVLKDFNLKIPAGKVVAIVGASGAGKSTIANLLERFYDINKGSITLDGQDIRQLDPSFIRGSAIGFINQEPALFATTLMENIRYGRPDATDSEVMEASKVANAHDFISSFPNGYNTIIGERGITMSGGQKQRVAIARAILKNPAILILDEATSALDAESESIVQKALDSCAQGRTVIIIAHRLSTIRNADIIAVLSQGKLVEIGDHNSLKKLGGIYSDLISQQQKDEKKTFWSLF